VLVLVLVRGLLLGGPWDVGAWFKYDWEYEYPCGVADGCGVNNIWPNDGAV
jgi:hypothetical protein